MKKAKCKVSKNILRLTSEDLKHGFEEIFSEDLNGYLYKHKRQLGIAPGKRIMIKWK